ncbi:MAG: DUF3300 domain-containing protein [Variovorax sp.]|nr:MAG: DUF3300 domain-containing protein [Variovorax sp.]
MVEQEWQTQRTVIKTEPANSQAVYVPAYNSAVVYGAWPCPVYPRYYYPPPAYYYVSRTLTRLCHSPCAKLRHTPSVCLAASSERLIRRQAGTRRGR